MSIWMDTGSVSHWFSRLDAIKRILAARGADAPDAVAQVTADNTAIASAITDLQARVAALDAGTDAADVQAAVDALASAHAASQSNLDAVTAIAPATPAA